MDGLVDKSGSKKSIRQTCVPSWHWVFLPKPQGGEVSYISETTMQAATLLTQT